MLRSCLVKGEPPLRLAAEREFAEAIRSRVYFPIIIIAGIEARPINVGGINDWSVLSMGEI